VKIDVRPINPAQVTFLHSEDKVFAYIGGLGAGKTHIGATDMILTKLTWPEADLLIAANTYQQLETATLPTLTRILDDWGIPYNYNKSQSDKHIVFLLPGHTGKIYCRSLENYDNALRGVEVLKIWMDEARDTAVEAFKTAIGRIRQRLVKVALKLTLEDGEVITLRKGQPVPVTVPPDVLPEDVLVKTSIRITTTPDMIKAKWLYDYLHNPQMKRELGEQGITIGAAHASSKDNPYLPADYVATLAASHDEQMRQQEIEGKWVIIPPGKPVYGSTFNEDVHTGEFDFNKEKELIIGWDFGFHRPAACFLQEDDNDRLICLGELLGEDQTLDAFCDDVWTYISKRFQVTGKIKSVEITSGCDPAGGQKSDKSELNSIQLLRRNGFTLVRHKKIELNMGLQVVRQQLNKLIAGKPALRFDRRHCPILIEGMKGGYHYPKKREEFSEEKEHPHKDGYYEHMMDALRYGVQNIRAVMVAPGKHTKPQNDKWTRFDSATGY
jgi:hypothetical protein